MANKKRLNNIDVMGSNYKIYYRTENEDPALTDCMEYCDKYQKLLVIDDTDRDIVKEYKKMGNDQWVVSYECMQKKVLRHELTHAFVTECGFAESCCDQWANNEEVIDFLALNAIKLVELFKKAGAI